MLIVIILMIVVLYTQLQIQNLGEYLLLQLASQDAIARLPMSGLSSEKERYICMYFEEQNHTSLSQALISYVVDYEACKKLCLPLRNGILLQVSLHYLLLYFHMLFHVRFF